MSEGVNGEGNLYRKTFGGYLYFAWQCSSVGLTLLPESSSNAH